MPFPWKRTTNQPKDGQTCRQTNNGQYKHDRQCTLNLILMRVRQTTFAEEKQKEKLLHILSVYVCVYSCLSYLACNVLAPYRHLWPVRLKIVFRIIS